MVNSVFKRDLAKGIRNAQINKELEPGVTPRRYEPVSGLKKHNERIHRESKLMDGNNLPFTFRKPPKPIGSTAYIQCDNCGHITVGTTATVGVICVECRTFSSVSEVTFDG